MSSNQISLAQFNAAVKGSRGFQLLTCGNPKTAKGEDKGYFTFILHLAPASLSGWNVCPMATAGCKAACLNTAGRIPVAQAVAMIRSDRDFIAEFELSLRATAAHAEAIVRGPWAERLLANMWIERRAGQ